MNSIRLWRGAEAGRFTRLFLFQSNFEAEHQDSQDCLLCMVGHCFVEGQIFEFCHENTYCSLASTLFNSKPVQWALTGPNAVDIRDPVSTAFPSFIRSTHGLIIQLVIPLF